MPTPTPIIWRGIVSDPKGRRYDVDQDLNVTLRKPEISFDDSGRIAHATGDREPLIRIIKSLEEHGQRMALVPGEEITIDVRQFDLTHPLDADTKRLCLKMAAAVARRHNCPLVLSNGATAYLLESAVFNVCPVRIALDEYNDLDRQRPRLGHLVYVRASKDEQRVYSVVQFFGVMQFYCQLADDWSGDEYAILATHDPVSHEENITPISPVNYVVPPSSVERGIYSKMWSERFERMRLELVSMYGDQAPLNLELNQ